MRSSALGVSDAASA